MRESKSRRVGRQMRFALPLLAILLVVSSCREPGPAEARPGQRLNLLVLTLDTIRADRLGAYGNTRIETPFVDELAERGVVFDRCIAPAPLTLPSHASLFTGTYPAFHGVRDNGNYKVPDQLRTMAELFRDHGYRTGAFVGAYVLSARWGLDQGFETFTEPASSFDPSLSSFAQIQRPAKEVVDDAIHWLGQGSEKPFFAWVHLYDPHLPYDPPAPFAAQYADEPYLGEVAYADAQMARLGAVLRSSGLDSRTMIVFAGDHGEGLGDHGELDHGLLLYQTTVRVPLIFVHPQLDAPVRRRPEVVSLVDLLPTIAEATGLPLPADLQGQSLLPLLGGAGQFEETPVVAETYYPKLHFGWSPLLAIQERGSQYIESPEPELFDLEADPGQERNLIAADDTRAEGLRRELEARIERLGQGALDAASTPDAETIAKLAALGYVVREASAPADGEELASPQSMLWLYNRLMAASAAVSSGDVATGEQQLREILAINGDLVDAWVALGRLYRRQGRLADAVEVLRQAHERRPLDPFLASKLADALISTRRLDEAAQLLEMALEKHPDDPTLVFSMARVLESSGQTAEAEVMFQRYLALDPASASAHVRLAALALRRGDAAVAGAELDVAVELDPAAPEANLFRGQLLESRGRLDEAAQAYRAELEAMPGSLPAALSLSRLEGRRGHAAEQERVLRDAIAANPRSPGPYLVLALTLLQRGERLAEAVELAELGVQQGPAGQELKMAYVLLANLHQRLGEPERASEYARLAEQVQ